MRQWEKWQLIPHKLQIALLKREYNGGACRRRKSSPPTCLHLGRLLLSLLGLWLHSLVKYSRRSLWIMQNVAPHLTLSLSHTQSFGIILSKFSDLLSLYRMQTECLGDWGLIATISTCSENEWARVSHTDCVTLILAYIKATDSLPNPSVRFFAHLSQKSLGAAWVVFPCKCNTLG